MDTKRFLALGCVTAVGAVTHAAIINNGGASDVLIAGPSVGYTSDFFDDPVAVVHGWDEVQSFTLTSNLTVDISTTGFYNSIGSLTPGTILAGTVVNSHMLYFDPLQNATAAAGFQFDGTIIGVIVDDTLKPTDYFMDSDYLIPGAVPLANIPTAHYSARGMELTGAGDSIQVNANSVVLNLSAASPGDQIRVLTVPVPEPCSILIGFGALVAVRRKRSGRDEERSS